jgi:hypothetical protein
LIAEAGIGAVDTAVKIVKLSDLTVNPIPLVLQKFSPPLVEFELKTLTGDFGRDTETGC